MIDDLYKYSDLMLATQSALLGEVVLSLRGVAVDWNNNTILIYFYNDGEISKDLECDYYDIGGGVVANYSDANISEKIIRLDYPAKLPEHKYWAYRRKEIPILTSALTTKGIIIYDGEGFFLQDLKKEEVKMTHTVVSLLLATQRALLGEVVPSLRAVTVDWNNNTILIYFYNDGEITAELHHDYSSIATEVLANYSDADLDDKIIRLDYPAKLPEHKYWAYRRKEIPI